LLGEGSSEKGVKVGGGVVQKTRQHCNFEVGLCEVVYKIGRRRWFNIS